VADLRAATSIQDIVAGRPRELQGARQNHIALDLCDGYRLVFCANHNKIPVCESGGVNWSKVNRVKIVEIEVEHG
jgi:hypothetical protein